MAIAFFYAVGTGLGGIIGPALFGKLIGVEELHRDDGRLPDRRRLAARRGRPSRGSSPSTPEQKSLEEVAEPLSSTAADDDDDDERRRRDEPTHRERREIGGYPVCGGRPLVAALLVPRRRRPARGPGRRDRARRRGVGPSAARARAPRADERAPLGPGRRAPRAAAGRRRGTHRARGPRLRRGPLPRLVPVARGSRPVRHVDDVDCFRARGLALAVVVGHSCSSARSRSCTSRDRSRAFSSSAASTGTSRPDAIVRAPSARREGRPHGCAGAEPRRPRGGNAPERARVDLNRNFPSLWQHFGLPARVVLRAAALLRAGDARRARPDPAHPPALPVWYPSDRTWCGHTAAALRPASLRAARRNAPAPSLVARRAARRTGRTTCRAEARGSRSSYPPVGDARSRWHVTDARCSAWRGDDVAAPRALVARLTPCVSPSQHRA